MEGLIPRGKVNLVFKLITLEETKLLLKSLKSSGSTGYDDLSSRTLKKCGDAIAPHLCHMINCIIRNYTFPSCFKVTRIIPILKPGKSPHEIDSFRPINCLTSLEKLVESWLCRTVTEWAESNHIIPPPTPWRTSVSLHSNSKTSFGSTNFLATLTKGSTQLC